MDFPLLRSAHNLKKKFSFVFQILFTCFYFFVFSGIFDFFNMFGCVTLWFYGCDLVKMWLAWYFICYIMFSYRTTDFFHCWTRGCIDSKRIKFFIMNFQMCMLSFHWWVARIDLKGLNFFIMSFQSCILSFPLLSVKLLNFLLWLGPFEICDCELLDVHVEFPVDKFSA